MQSMEIRQKQKEVLERIRKMSAYIECSEYTIVLLLDISGSMSGEKIKDAKEAIIHFLRRTNHTVNEVGLVTFGRLVTPYDFTHDQNRLEAKIKSFEAGGDTPMMKAIMIAFESFLKKKANKPVMIIATDGQPTDAPEEVILEYASSIKGKGVRLITIGIGEDVYENFLKRLASSPEDYHIAKASFELKKIYKEVADMLALPEKKARCLKEV